MKKSTERNNMKRQAQQARSQARNRKRFEQQNAFAYALTGADNEQR